MANPRKKNERTRGAAGRKGGGRRSGGEAKDRRAGAGDEGGVVTEVGRKRGREIDELDRGMRKAKLPESVSGVIEKEMSRLRSMEETDDEYANLFSYLSLLRDLPWQAKPPKAPSFKRAHEILDESHFGIDKVKDRILEQLAVMRLKGRVRGPILLLSGPPGVGKTSLARALADAMGRPFQRIAMGGINDEVEIRGHRRTYVGAMPGRIIQAMKRARSSHPVILLDEIDKIDRGAKGGSAVASALLELLDPEQNKAFADNFLGVPFDLSNVFFIATANSVDEIPEPLLDRMETIWLSAYTDDEKIKIASTFLLPEIREDVGLTKGNLRLDDEAVRFLLRHYTREAGVRNLKRELSNIARKIARGLVERRGTARRAGRITREDIVKWLGPMRYVDEPDDKLLPPGVAVGLAVDETGGEILYVETSKSRARSGGGRLQLTGRMGPVMRESAQTALSFLLAHGEKVGINPEDVEDSNIHIHLPDGATPKDGPSAGVAFLAALVSLFSGKSIPASLAMTGEVTLRGQVLAIGGLKEKVLAAARYGKTRVLIPAANWHEVDEIPRGARAKTNIIPVSSMTEVLAHAGLSGPGSGERSTEAAVEPPSSDEQAKD